MNILNIVDIVNHSEGDDFPKDSLFVVGRLIQQNKFNGVYIVFNSPIKYTTDYVSSIDFTSKNGVCSNRFCVMIRNSCGKWIMGTNKAVSPDIM